ncbi:hypothetical protein CBM2623_U50032 [Cupriavidus taiwanensis]|nr:hypothetical protein CBM2608_U50001 [Cupriavidus taiwanensis]SPA38467.1 hypothetical protein CBM2623_U50032 [Cupriavidus taiwanensis]
MVCKPLIGQWIALRPQARRRAREVAIRRLIDHYFGRIIAGNMLALQSMQAGVLDHGDTDYSKH